MKYLKSMLLYLLPIIFAFYILPLLGKNTGASMLIQLIAIPIICLISSFLFGYKYGGNIIYPLAVAILFIPTIFIYYNISAWIYIIAYTMLAFAGLTIGHLMGYNKKNKAQ